MKLYKYAPLNTAIKILTTGTVAFSPPTTFNDPFDVPKYPLPAPKKNASTPLQDFSLSLASYHSEMKSAIWKKSIGVLCLTRSSDNPLMWSHYADSHKGVVIGFDVKAAGLCDEKTNIVPAQFGSVIYMNKRNTEDFVGVPENGYAIGETKAFRVDHYEKLQRLLLSKPLDWAYEEEVRVVKLVKDLLPDWEHSGTKDVNVDVPIEAGSGKFTIISNPQNTDVASLSENFIYAFHIPSTAITEVHLGARCSKTALDGQKSFLNHVSFFQCQPDLNNFKITSLPIDLPGS